MKVLRIFAASPSDLATEHTKVATVASMLKPLAQNLGIVLDVVDWAAVVPDMGSPEQVSSINSSQRRERYYHEGLELAEKLRDKHAPTAGNTPEAPLRLQPSSEAALTESGGSVHGVRSRMR